MSEETVSNTTSNYPFEESLSTNVKILEQITLSINDRKIQVPCGTTILEAARKMGVFIPTLCNHPDLAPRGSCRVCVVEVEGEKTLQASCEYKITKPINVHTQTYKVIRAREEIIDLLFGKHYGFWDHNNCPRTGTCELQAIAKYGTYPLHYGAFPSTYPVDESSYSIVRDANKCILCFRCVETCNEIQGVGCIQPVGQGATTQISTFLNEPIGEAVCINCGQCIEHCPTAALHTVDSAATVRELIQNPQKHVVIQTAPAPRAAIGECFGQEPGRAFTLELNTGLRKLGFDKVFDTTFSADLTILEEGTELLERLYQTLVEKKDTALPMFTSCSPGWVKFLEHFYPEYIPNLSSAKSPQQMFGAVIKTYYAQLTGIDPKDIVTVALMPCTAKKFECNRSEMNDSGFQDVDFALTTREMAGMLKKDNIDLPHLIPSDFDQPFGPATGSGVIFGATGGVMESALRTVIELVTGQPVEKYFTHADIQPVRGMDGVKKAKVTIPETGNVPPLLQNILTNFDWLKGATVKVAVVHGTANARKVLENIKAGGEFASYHFIEFMACPGGCLGGGGQPIPTTPAIRKARANALYTEDSHSVVRKSFENPAVIELYHDFLTEGPGGHKSHELLHTHYSDRGK
jgi:NADH-quinone oxidoreductase subunit G/[NiFe] hydrogenase diaphorase moiety small subunit